MDPLDTNLILLRIGSRTFGLEILNRGLHTCGSVWNYNYIKMAGRVLLRQPQLLPTSGCLCSVPFRVRAAKSRPCSPIHAQPANGGLEESGSGWSDQRDSSGLDDELRVDPGLELAANSWPRIILDEPRQQTREVPTPEPPLRAADKARGREAMLLRLATLGFAVRPSPPSFRTNNAQH